MCAFVDTQKYVGSIFYFDSVSIQWIGMVVGIIQYCITSLLIALDWYILFKWQHEILRSIHRGLNNNYGGSIDKGDGTHKHNKARRYGTHKALERFVCVLDDKSRKRIKRPKHTIVGSGPLSSTISKLHSLCSYCSSYLRSQSYIAYHLLRCHNFTFRSLWSVCSIYRSMQGEMRAFQAFQFQKSLASYNSNTFILLLTQGGLRAGKWMSSLCKMSSLRNICTTCACACATQHSTKTKERATITTYNRHNITTIISFPPWTVPNHQRKFVHIHVIIYSFRSGDNIY